MAGEVPGELLSSTYAGTTTFAIRLSGWDTALLPAAVAAASVAAATLAAALAAAAAVAASPAG